MGKTFKSDPVIFVRKELQGRKDLQSLLIKNDQVEEPAEYLVKMFQDSNVSESQVVKLMDLLKDILTRKELQVRRLKFAELHLFVEEVIKCIGKTSNLEFVVAFGASLSPPLIRTPCYLVSALEIIRIFLKWQKDLPDLQIPKLRVVDASKLGIEVNFPTQKDAVLDNSEKRNLFLADFVIRFAPDLGEYVTFCTDQSVDYPKEEEASQWFEKSNALNTQDFRKEFDHMVETNLKRLPETLSYSQKIQRVKRYIAGHPYIFGDIVDDKNKDLFQTKKFYVGIGGVAERRFFLFRKTLHPTTTNMVLVSEIGTHPPYYEMPGLDYLIKNFDQNQSSIQPQLSEDVDKETESAAKKIRKDNQAIIEFISKEPNAEISYIRFVHSHLEYKHNHFIESHNPITLGFNLDNHNNEISKGKDLYIPFERAIMDNYKQQGIQISAEAINEIFKEWREKNSSQP